MMRMTIEFVRLAPSDADVISEIIHRWWIIIYSGEITSGTAGLDDIFNREERPEHVRAHMDKGMVYEKVLLDGEEIGLVAYIPVAPELYVDKLYLDSPVRGRGIGTKCMEHMFETARANGCSRAALVASEKNEPAHRFYQKTGFFKVGRSPVYDHLGVVGFRIRFERVL